MRKLNSELPEVLYRSENFILVNKGFDIKINSDQTEEVTVATQLSRMFPELADSSLTYNFRFGHRLDYATSGILCLALNKKAAGHLHKAFVRHRVKKLYLALVRGHVDWDRLMITTPIGRNSHVTDIHKMCVDKTPGCTNLKFAKTLAVRLEHGTYSNEPASKVALVPFTGRTHQLRVHCADSGHTVVGDYTYSDRKDTEPYRMMLHSCKFSVKLLSENIHVVTQDPFTPQQDDLWVPKKYFLSCDDFEKMFKPEDSDKIDDCSQISNSVTSSPSKAEVDSGRDDKQHLDGVS
ncbi:hypothetical protein ScPMuIL_004243 [Solemya velum]